MSCGLVVTCGLILIVFEENVKLRRLEIERSDSFSDEADSTLLNNRVMLSRSSRKGRGLHLAVLVLSLVILFTLLYRVYLP